MRRSALARLGRGVRVAVDTTPLRLTSAGTARYLRNLLARIEPGNEVRRVAFGGPGRVSVLARELAWYPFALGRLEGVDVLHCPTYYGPLRTRVPLVVTVLDLSVFRHPEAFPRWTRTAVPALAPRVLRAATRILAISEFTKRELVEVLDVPAEKVAAVPLAVETEVFRAEGAAEQGEYVLAVATLEPRKNLARLAEATRRLGVELRVAGAPGWGGVSVAGNGVRPLGRVSDEELARLYRGAAVAAYPSLYEGFGFPVLEAMACGAPVVTSRGGATEEVANGAAVLVDPLDPASIAAGIEEAMSRRDELRTLGHDRAAAFSWDETARRTLEVYREAAG
jgi:glycosyltransferase involved in cell wall biosynthesis